MSTPAEAAQPADVSPQPRQFVYGFSLDPTGLQIAADVAQVQFADVGGQIDPGQLAAVAPTAGQTLAFDGTQLVWTTFAAQPIQPNYFGLYLN